MSISFHAVFSSCVVTTNTQFTTPPQIGSAEYSDDHGRVCLVCLFVRDHISGTTRQIFTTFLCMLLIAMARSSSGGVVIRYVFPVLWTTLGT